MVKINFDKIYNLDIDSIRVTGKNDLVYNKRNKRNHDFYSIVESIEKHGLLNPIAISLDGYVISGHTRLEVCKYLGHEKIKVYYLDVLSNSENFMNLLVSANMGRVKTINETLKEGCIQNDSTYYYQSEKIKQSKADLWERVFVTGESKKYNLDLQPELVKAILQIIEDEWEYLPITLRAIHYRAIKKDIQIIKRGRGGSFLGYRVYTNTKNDYNNILCPVVTAMRENGLIDYDYIEDNTRPERNIYCHNSVNEFVLDQQREFLQYYRRNLLQSQETFFLLLCEKRTVNKPIQNVLKKYPMSYFTGGGFQSVTMINDVSKLFKNSGKENMVVFAISDLDSSGEHILNSFKRKLNEVHKINNVDVIKTMVTEKVKQKYNLPSCYKLSSNGEEVEQTEIDSLTGKQIETILDETIRKFIDTDLYNYEVNHSNIDSEEIHSVREKVNDYFLNQF